MKIFGEKIKNILHSNTTYKRNKSAEIKSECIFPN